MGEISTQSSELRVVGPRYSPFSAPYRLVGEVFAQRYLVRNLAMRTIRSRYRKSIIGYGWALVEPAVFTLVYYILFVMIRGNPDPLYAVWVVTGVITFSTFTRSMTGALSSISGNGGTIHCIYFPRQIFAFSNTVAIIIVNLFSSLIFIPIIIYYGFEVNLYMLMIPLGIIWAGIMGMVVSLPFSPLNCSQRDVEHLFGIIARSLFFLSPVMWTVEMAYDRGEFGRMMLWNPLTTPITMVRHGISGDSIGIESSIVISAILFTVLCWLIGSIYFARNERQAVKYL